MKVILVDLMHLAHRSWHVHQTLETKGKGLTGIVYGCLVGLLTLQQRFPDTAMVICNDQGKSWRKDVAPTVYKVNRGDSGMLNPLFADQMVALKQHFLDVVGFKYVAVDTIEGDDVVSLMTHGLTARQDVDEVLIYSGDRDFYQLIGPKVKVAKPAKEIEIIDDQYVIKRFGIKPKDWVKMRAISGDSSDGMKAKKGIGPKTAVVLLAHGVDPSKDEVHPALKKALSEKPKYAELLSEETWKAVRLSYRLSILPKVVDDLPLKVKVRAELGRQINAAVSDPRRLKVDVKARGALLRRNLVDWAMESIVGRRRQFFLIP